jgi:hypothetical protein
MLIFISLVLPEEEPPDELPDPLSELPHPAKTEAVITETNNIEISFLFIRPSFKKCVVLVRNSKFKGSHFSISILKI